MSNEAASETGCIVCSWISLPLLLIRVAGKCLNIARVQPSMSSVARILVNESM